MGGLCCSLYPKRRESVIQGKGFYVWRAEKVLERLGTADVAEEAEG